MRFQAESHGEPDSRCGRQRHRQVSVNMRPVSETSVEILFHKICMCSPTALSKRRCLQHPQSQRNTFLANLEDENARPGTLCERPLSLVLPNDSAHIACSRGRSLSSSLHGRIYAGVLGACLGRVAYMSHVV